MSKVIATLSTRHYGHHRPVKTFVLPGVYTDYVNDDLADSMTKSHVNEEKLLNALPENWLPVSPKDILLIGGHTAVYATEIFRTWSKYYDSYSLWIEDESVLSLTNE